MDKSLLTFRFIRRHFRNIFKHDSEVGIGLVEESFKIYVVISMMRTIVASPEKLQCLFNELCSTECSKLAINATQICSIYLSSG